MVSRPKNQQFPRKAASRLSNIEVAQRLERGAELLDAQGANPFRVQAYRHAARTVRQLPTPLADWLTPANSRAEPSGNPLPQGRISLFDEDVTSEKSVTSVTREASGAKVESEDPLEELLQTFPGIGVSLAKTISGLVRTGRWELLEELSGETSPDEVLSTVAGIGPQLADRIHSVLGIETLPELAAAARDGRLSHVPGFGPKRLRAVRETLAGRLRLSDQDLRRAGQVSAEHPPLDEPPVAELLSIDEQYRRQAAAGLLPKIAPRKFNPTRAAWLPILHAQRSGRQYTAMYSNTARAHDLGTTRDWVVIHRDDKNGRGQWTVVTAQYGPQKGERVVRGREEE